MSDTITIAVYDGKYTFRWSPVGGVVVDRYDTRDWWEVTAGSNAVLALMQHAENQKSALDAANEALRLERAEVERLRDAIWEAHARLSDVVGRTAGHNVALRATRRELIEAAEPRPALSPRPGANEQADE